MSTTEPATASRRLLIVAVLLLAFGGAGFGIGRYQGAMALESATERFQRDRLALQTQVSQAGARLQSCQTERDLLAARRSLSLVALALEQRNFGTAEAHRRQALDQLTSDGLSAVGGVDTVAKRVTELNLAVDPEPGDALAEVSGIVEVLDQIEIVAGE